ncbi:MAG TPA: AraC family transcriptional regulator [Candidatus Saccharimonadales bacterium]|nr:AraC family transcriptional regulator [Candidatus Saccharimonadales bacterium]
MLLERLFENLALNVDPFATCRVADGWRLKLPCRDWVTFHYTLEGDGGLRIGSGEILSLTRSSLAVIPPGLAHSIQCGSVSGEIGIEGQGDPGAPLCELVAGPLDNVKLTIACGRVQVIYAGGAGLFEHLREAIVLDFEGSPEMRGIFEALIEEYRRSGPASAAMMTALMNQCLILVLRRVSEESKGGLPWLSALEDHRLECVMETILAHPERRHTVESLAGVAHMSRSTFARHFEQCFERSPMDYVRDVRLRRAARLLRIGDLSVDGVAAKVGFASRSHFSRAFRVQFGCAPAQFRKQNS